jgi:TPR repeat protein
LAKQGDAAAQNNLGHLYLGDAQGVVPQDFAEALKWYSKAAEQWHASAHFSIGMLHLLGLGVTRDNAEAVKWIRKSAEQGYEYAQYFLGNMYVTGWEGAVPQDDTEAKKWMLKAAKQGNLDARRYLRK